MKHWASRACSLTLSTRSFFSPRLPFPFRLSCYHSILPMRQWPAFQESTSMNTNQTHGISFANRLRCNGLKMGDSWSGMKRSGRQVSMPTYLLAESKYCGADSSTLRALWTLPGPSLCRNLGKLRRDSCWGHLGSEISQVYCKCTSTLYPQRVILC